MLNCVALCVCVRWNTQLAAAAWHALRQPKSWAGLNFFHRRSPHIFRNAGKNRQAPLTLNEKALLFFATALDLVRMQHNICCQSRCVFIRASCNTTRDRQMLRVWTWREVLSVSEDFWMCQPCNNQKFTDLLVAAWHGSSLMRTGSL